MQKITYPGRILVTSFEMVLMRPLADDQPLSLITTINLKTRLFLNVKITNFWTRI